MKALKRLKDIANEMDSLGRSMRKETAVCAAELEERQRLGLTGDDAIRHYNEWMDRNNMSHLKIS